MRACVSALWIALLVGPGCAVRSAMEIGRAERVLTEANARGAAPDAIYDQVLARRYIDKAREEAARTQHRVAVEYARFALEHALQVKAPAPDPSPPQGGPPPDAPPTPTTPSPGLLWDGLDTPAPSPP